MIIIFNNNNNIIIIILRCIDNDACYLFDRCKDIIHKNSILLAIFAYLIS